LKLKPKIIHVLFEHSRVLKDIPNDPDGLTRNDLVGMLVLMVFGIAACRGTSALLDSNARGYADEVIRDDDRAKLRNAVLNVQD